ncbi:hypothetical protein ElyMa_005252700 [Elysia marginata]|uniref:Uncharacterized protein n=1 Tax=Elysia marginata TaxID=1093978 RepID=A0AAV4JWY2_9GAST|nr:hypothetical protein ElyMa_005252700 [Elysia marginata]
MLKGCPITNLLGERAFGDLDFDFQKRRHTSLHHRSSVHMFRKNHLAEWTTQQENYSSLMLLARKMGPVLRKKHKENEEKVLKTLRERQVQNELEKKEKELKAVEDICKLPLHKKMKRGANNENFSEDSDERTEEESDEEANTAANFIFQFSQQGQWVAVYFDNTFYVGQVITVHSPVKAHVKFLTVCAARTSCYRWPLFEDIAETESKFVFRWDFDVVPAAGGRLWDVPDNGSIKKAYQRLKSSI